METYISADPNYTIADDNREGIRVSGRGGWFLLRMSVHDPVMPLNFECDNKQGIGEMINDLKPFFAGFSNLVLPEVLA